MDASVTKYRKRTLWFVPSLVLAILCLTAAGARSQSRPMSIERLVRDAGIIFAGKVVDVTTGEKDPRMNLYMTLYTFVVEDPMWGVATDSITIKQYGGEANGRSYYPPGVPRFKKGEDVVAFLYPPSRIGMTSAVGKGQGKFTVGPPDTNGVRMIENETHNRDLFRRIRHEDLVEHPAWLASGFEGPVEYRPFVSTVRKLINAVKNR